MALPLYTDFVGLLQNRALYFGQVPPDAHHHQQALTLYTASGCKDVPVRIHNDSQLIKIRRHGKNKYGYFFELFYTLLRQITCLSVRWWNIDDMVKPARSEQGTVQTIRSVCRSYNHHIIVANFLVVQLSSIKKDDQNTAYWSVVAFAWKWGRSHISRISDHVLSVAFLCSLCLEDLLRSSPLQRFQADSIHLI